MKAEAELFERPKAAPDYFAVYGPKGFKCNVLAISGRDALRIARDQGLTIPRGSTAHRIGRAGYFRALALAFPNPAK